MHKTGTSSIQAAMAGYDDGATAYLDWPDPNHSLLMGIAFFESDIPRQIARGFATDETAYRATAEKLRAKLAERLSRNDRDIVISGEDMCLHWDESDVQGLCIFLAEWFDEVFVIAYVREPVSYITSAFQQIQKTKRVEFDPVAILPEYRRLFEAWNRVIPGERKVFLLYDRSSLVGGDVVEDFASRLGLGKVLRDHRVNETLSAEAVSVLFLLWRLPFIGPDQRRKLVKTWLPRLETFGWRRLVLSPARQEQVHALVADDVAWVRTSLGLELTSRQVRGKAVTASGTFDLWRILICCALPAAVIGSTSRVLQRWRAH